MDLSVRFYPLARWARLSSHAVRGRGVAQPDWLRVALPDSQPRRLTPRPDTAPGQGARTGRPDRAARPDRHDRSSGEGVIRPDFHVSSTFCSPFCPVSTCSTYSSTDRTRSARALTAGRPCSHRQPIERLPAPTSANGEAPSHCRNSTRHRVAASRLAACQRRKTSWPRLRPTAHATVAATA
jgi:hypothetical protein